MEYRRKQWWLISIVCIDITWADRVTVDRKLEQQGCHFVAFYDKMDGQTSITVVSLGHKCVANHQQVDCSFNSFLKHRSLWPVDSHQKASIAGSFSLLRYHHGYLTKEGVTRRLFFISIKEGKMFTSNFNTNNMFIWIDYTAFFKFSNNINNFVNSIQLLALVPGLSNDTLKASSSIFEWTRLTILASSKFPRYSMITEISVVF